MSVLTQKKCLEGVRPGSAAYIVEHARWRRSRGKRPSLVFLGEFNPRKALEKAIKEAGSYEIQAKFWLKNIRGNDPLLSSFESFEKYALKLGAPLSHFGTSERELGDLKLRYYEIQANFWLKNLKGDNPTSHSLEYIKKYALASGKPLSHFGVSEKELEELSRKI